MLGFSMFAAVLVFALVSDLPLIGCIYLDPDVAIGGDAPEYRYPFMVQLQQFMVVSYVHHCGGSLLTASYILTAAHCTTEVLKLQAQAGTVWSNSKVEGQRRNVIRMLGHSRYIQDGTTGPYDIGLALVEEPFLVDGVNVGIIPLLPDYYVHPSETDVMGFGKIDLDDTLPDRLRVVRCSLHPSNDCENDARTDAFCVGSAGATACQGDSGGPVVGTIDGVDWLVGLVSHGKQECGSGPIICTDVKFYEDWIKEAVHNLTFDTDEAVSTN
ncbi:lectizyme-like isoform X1 [Anopheles funestus]|uniref:lectizyme-like isoform X1 n=2 Tax=Anopheles funestus TaxID=62324 RepID=UPI0020C62B6B|nr:lectizyme-like isoform X1 [Anopheles funestus]